MQRCKCGSRRRSNGQRYCLKCHAKHMRKWRASNPLEGDARMKMNTRAYTHVYVKRGKLKKLPCRVCGKPSEAHHADYSKPLKVDWLCRKHHLTFHVEQFI
jgi:hypothetical protein